MSNTNKQDIYLSAIQQITAVVGSNGHQIELIGKMALVCAILKIHFPHWVFVGFYRHTQTNLLEIGPYQGSLIACGTISFEHGVCGAAARNQNTIIVDDVSQFPGYIACDEITKSEIVIPVIKQNKLIAVLDIDGAETGLFDSVDQQYLEKIIGILEK